MAAHAAVYVVDDDAEQDDEVVDAEQDDEVVVLDGAGPNTLSMVKREDDGWTLLGLYCNPNERDLDVVADAEAETIGAIRDAAGVPLGFLGGVEETLVGSYGT